ncbi:MAG: hypothetical protein ACWGOY_12905 [Anaerolineales bacterium]
MKFLFKFVSFIVISLALVGMTLGVALSAGTPVVIPGFDPTAVLLGGVRYRELATGNDDEVFLGVPDLGDGTHRSQTNLVWGSSNDLTFTYDPILDKLSTTVDNGTSSWTLDYLDFSDQVRDLLYGGNQGMADEALNRLNYLQISLRMGESSPAQLSLEDVSLDGYALGNFTGVNHETMDWQVNGYDLFSGFTLTGTLNLSNVNSPSAELNKISITFGYVNTDTSAPEITNVVATPNPVIGGGNVTLTASVDDSGSGGSIIQSAEYNLEGGAWTPMSAADGTLDSPTENVTASFVAPTSDGPYSVCVHGTDSAINTSLDQCITLNVDSQGPLTSTVQVDPQKVGGGENVNLTALVDDSTMGGSNIQSAEYSLNGVDWNPMNPEDTSFDSATESVVASFLSPVMSGEINVCVRGTDAAGNTGIQACTNLAVDAQGPLTTIIIIDPNPADAANQVDLSASLDDSSTGNSNLTSAEFQVDSGPWVPMLAQDGTFNSPTEQVTAQFTAPQSTSTVEICVRGTDFYGNTGSTDCNQLEISGGVPADPPLLYLPILVSNFSSP